MVRFASVKAGANAVVAAISYLIAVAAAVRGIISYPELQELLLGLLAIYVVLLAAERLMGPDRPGWRLALIAGQVGMMVWLYLVAPLADPWALLLLPACLSVMQLYRPTVGWSLVAAFSVVMSIMIIRGEALPGAAAFIIIYVPAYLLVASASLALRRAHEARAESEALVNQVTEAHAQLKEYASRVEELVSVRERGRIARDLHDTVTQTIFSMTLIARSTRMLAKEKPDQAAQQLAELESLSQAALKEMRALINELRPVLISEAGLVAALERHVADLRERNGLDVRLEVTGSEPDMELGDKRNVFVLIQEALNNVVKHASATEATVRLQSRTGSLELEVADNGVGFTPDSVTAEPGHIGLSSMRERAAELGADISINSEPDGGTTVRVVLPGADGGADG